MPHDGVLIIGFGGPDCLEAVGPFMCNLMGREPSEALVARVSARYETIGGSSPMLRIAGELAEAVADALASAGTPVPVEVGMRYWEPLVADAIDRLVEGGVDRVVTVSLSAYEAQVTAGEYRAAVAEALARHAGVTAIAAPLLSAVPAFIDLHAEAAAAALGTLGPGPATVVFSAHSLPLEDVAKDDSYARGFEAAAAEVAARLGLGAGCPCEVLPGITSYGSAETTDRWLVAYQSRGARGGEWLGPDLDDVIDAIAASEDTGVVVVPLGFATDHLETLYDLDVVARGRADAAGLAFVRSAVPNADARMAAGVAEEIRKTAAQTR